MIDIFENEKFVYIATAFILGSIIPNVIYPIHAFIYKPFDIGNSTNPVFNFLFFTLAVGLLEEIVKVLPLLILLKIFKSAVNEPLDYIKYACVSALGFAFGENIEYALRYNESILIVRSILSVPAHVFFSTIFIYGYILFKYNGKSLVSVLKFGFFGFLAHGLYDFVLDNTGFTGVLLNLLLFLLIISVFVNIINNGLNNSPFYKPNRTIDQSKVQTRLALLYTIAIIAILVTTGIYQDVRNVVSLFYKFLLFDFIILFVLIVRLSRMSIIPKHWNEIKIEFPLGRKSNSDESDFRILGLTIKGESYNEYQISTLFEQNILVVPLSSRKGFLNKIHSGIIEKKLNSEGETVFILKLFLDKERISFRHFLLATKRQGITLSEDKYPIASLNSVKEGDELLFHEWVILKKET